MTDAMINPNAYPLLTRAEEHLANARGCLDRYEVDTLAAIEELYAAVEILVRREKERIVYEARPPEL